MDNPEHDSANLIASHAEAPRNDNAELDETSEQDRITTLASPLEHRATSCDPSRTLINLDEDEKSMKAVEGIRLRRKTKYLFYLFFYIPLLVIPWALLCVLTYRPLQLPSYVNQKGIYHPADFEGNENWQVAIRFANTVTAIITLPLVSAILSQASVIYTQRRKISQKMSLLQTFALADKGWSDVTVWTSRKKQSPLLIVGAAFFGLCQLTAPGHKTVLTLLYRCHCVATPASPH